MRALIAYINGKEIIIGPAVMCVGTIYSKSFFHNHLDCIKEAKELTDNKVVIKSKGFLTSQGRYVGRAEAFNIAVNSNQLLIKKLNGQTELFTTDIW